MGCECKQCYWEEILGHTCNGWGSEAGGEAAAKGCRSMPRATMLNSAGELGEMVGSTPKLFLPEGRKRKLLSSDSKLILVRQLPGAVAPPSFELGRRWRATDAGPVGTREVTGRSQWLTDGLLGLEMCVLIRGRALGRSPSPSLHPLSAPAGPAFPGIGQGWGPCRPVCRGAGTLSSFSPPLILPQVQHSGKGRMWSGFDLWTCNLGQVT